MTQVPRVTRQSVLERLAGQHLALALHTVGQPIDEAALLALPEGRKAALEAASAQEEATYARGKLSKSVNFLEIARTSLVQEPGVCYLSRCSCWLDDGKTGE